MTVDVKVINNVSSSDTPFALWFSYNILYDSVFCEDIFHFLHSLLKSKNKS